MKITCKTFKKENNIGITKPDNQPPPNPQKDSKKAALKAVTNRRGAVNLNQPDSEDFENAFEEALSK